MRNQDKAQELPSTPKRSFSNILADKLDLTEQTEHSMFSTSGDNQQKLQEDEINGTTKISKPLIKTQSKSSVLESNIYNTLSQRTKKRDWYLNAPSSHLFYDEAYKVVPSLNQGIRLQQLSNITKVNARFYERLQSIKSDYDTSKLLEKSKEQSSYKQRISQFKNGRPKRDPLELRHKMQS